METEPDTLDKSSPLFIQSRSINPPSLPNYFIKHPFTDEDGQTSTYSTEVEITPFPDRGGIPDTLSMGSLRDMTRGERRLNTKPIVRMGRDNVINELTTRGLEDFAERLQYLYEVTEEDEEGIRLDSLRSFAIFMIKNRGMTPPQITITTEGLIQAIWRHPRQGTLVMNFQDPDNIAFTLLYGRWDQETRRHNLSGTVSPDQAIMHAHYFVHKAMMT